MQTLGIESTNVESVGNSVPMVPVVSLPLYLRAGIYNLLAPRCPRSTSASQPWSTTTSPPWLDYPSVKRYAPSSPTLSLSSAPLAPPFGPTRYAASSEYYSYGQSSSALCISASPPHWHTSNCIPIIMSSAGILTARQSRTTTFFPTRCSTRRLRNCQ